MPDTSTEATDDVPPTDSLTDPETLRDREDVRFTEETVVRGDRDHCATDIAGRAVVGVTDGAGAVLLAIHEADQVGMLPHGPVDPGDDWAEVARDTVEPVTGVPFELDGVEVVRELDHVVEGEDEPHSSTHNVIFRASLADAAAREADPSLDENDHWNAGWFDEVPDELVPDEGPVEDDVRMFVD
ncbi:MULTISPECIES: hypothetical protein [Halorussus]|uniref:hypothetical protein n=1 Tax=Halorussus TaxID=1070314 RepID=UPI0013B40380|nr:MULTISPECIES: hypothetical protein [Halorussus]NHN61318.1 hypothetical protein [Halorussus sp. JP-T4]